MKAWKTVLFIFSTLAGLAAICLFFPKDGINIGGITLEFPSLAETISPAPQPESGNTQPVDKEVQNQLDALHNAKKKEFDDFCKNSPTRIYMPGNDLTYLDPLFKSLEDARHKPMRIVHYGDSQLETDRMTSTLREHFQAKFGGGGVGMIPAVQPIETYTLSQTVSPELTRYCAYGSAEFRANHHRYGPMAAMSRIDGVATLSFRSRGEKDYPHCQQFQKISVVMKGSGTITANLAGKSLQLTPDFNDENIMRTFSTTLPSETDMVRLKISGCMEIYAVMLDGKDGVSMDNIPMRGCSGLVFTTIDRNTFAPFFKRQNVKLIILQYGGNSVPFLTGRKSIAAYKNQIKQQIALFKKVAPDARILFIGPSDMSTRINGTMQSYPHIEETIDALRQAANEEGIAFWNMYKAQGGHNSMVKWVNARPQLAGGDYIHFTPLGAEKMSQILYDTFLLYYRYYKFRTGYDKDF